MKKPSRIYEKGKHAAGQPQTPNRPAPRARVSPKRKRAIAALHKSPGDTPLPDERKFGEKLASLDISPCGEQTLRRKGGKYTIVTTHNKVRDGACWVPWDEWAQSHPREALTEQPRSRVRQLTSAETFSHEQVVGWLYANMHSLVIPPEFREDFRPSARGPRAVEWSFIMNMEEELIRTEGLLSLIATSLVENLDKSDDHRQQTAAVGIRNLCSERRRKLSACFNALCNEVRESWRKGQP
jgi:hypothetical protein